MIRALTDPKVLAVLFGITVLSLGFLVAGGMWMTSRLEAREAELAALPPDQRLEREIDDIGKMTAALGLDVSKELDELKEMTREMDALAVEVRDLQEEGVPPEEIEALIAERFAELDRRAQDIALGLEPEAPKKPTPGQPIVLPVINKAEPEPMPLPPAWLVAVLGFFGIAAFGGIGAVMLMGGGGDEPEGAPPA